MTQTANTKYAANPDRRTLIQRLKEANLTLKRFLKVGKDKAAFEDKWQNNLYTPEELKNYPRWGICGGDGLVPLEADKPEMVEVLRTVLPPTLEVITPRRRLPHFFLKVPDGEVPNRVLHLPNDEEGAGEIRAKNQYFVAAGTTIKFNDLKTGELKTGTYKILHDRPIATISHADFMKAVKPYLGKNSEQRITKDIMQNGAEKGTRHAYGIRYATRLIRFEKLDPVAALDVMKRWNQKCKPPMNEHDLERMIKKAMEYAFDDQQEDKPSIPSVWVSPELVRHIFSDLGRRVKRDNTTKAAVLFSALSAYLSNPLNLFEKGSSGSGKTYNAIETLEYFPQDDIWFLSGMSPKALVHQKSQLLDKDGNEIFLTDRPTKPKKREYKTENEYDNAVKEYEKQKKIFSERVLGSYHYINIENKIFVFLETPDPETMRMLFPILSHDKKRIEYRFVNKTQSGLRTELVIIEGYPTAIFLTTDRKYVEELATRSFTVSPEESTEKIGDANKLTNLKAAVPWECKLETPRFLATKRLIQNIKETLKNEQVDVIIPFLGLHEIFPKDVARDMRDFAHFTQFLKSFTILHLFQRHVLVMENKKYVIATNYDVFCCYKIFKELIELTRTGTEKRILDFYHNFVKNKEFCYVAELTSDYNAENKVSISDYTIRKWVDRLNQIGYVEKREDDADKRKIVIIPLVKETTEKRDNACIFENHEDMVSILEKGFNSWLDRYKKTNIGKLNENVYNPKEIHNAELTEHILLNEKTLFSFVENVFQYLSEDVLTPDSENNPKNTCIDQNHIFSHKLNCHICGKTLQSNYFKVDNNPVCFNCYFNTKSQTCPICGGDMPLSQLSNVNGKPACKSCAKKLEVPT